MSAGYKHPCSAAARRRNGILPYDPLRVGEAAVYAGVSSRTVTKWVDSKKLKGYRLPGSHDRRILARDLVIFMRERGIPLHPDLSTAAGPSLLALWLEPTDLDSLGAEWVDCGAYDLGSQMATSAPQCVVIGDREGLTPAAAVGRCVLRDRPHTTVILVVSEDAPETIPGWNGPVIRRPCDLRAAVLVQMNGGAS